MPFKAKNNREAVVVCAIHVVKRPSKRSVLVCHKLANINLTICTGRANPEVISRRKHWIGGWGTL